MMSDADQMAQLNVWLEEVSFSRENCLRSITREFSDGFCVAEICAHHVPKSVDLNSYHPVSSTPQKVTQWKTLNKKTLSKMNCTVPDDLIQLIVNQKKGAIELMLRNLKLRIEQYLRGPKKDEDDTGTSGDGGFALPPAGAKKKSTTKKGPKGAQRETTTLSGGGGSGSDEMAMALEVKERIICDYEEVVEVFLQKVKKLEALLKLKDRMIESLQRKLKENGIR